MKSNSPRFTPQIIAWIIVILFWLIFGSVYYYRQHHKSACGNSLNSLEINCPEIQNSGECINDLCTGTNTQPIIPGQNCQPQPGYACPGGVKVLDN